MWVVKVITLLNASFKQLIGKVIAKEEMLTPASELRKESPEYLVRVDYCCIKKIKK